MIVKRIQDLGKRMEAKTEKMQEMFNKDLEELKNKQTEMNKTKLTQNGLNINIRARTIKLLEENISEKL